MTILAKVALSGAVFLVIAYCFGLSTIQTESWKRQNHEAWERRVFVSKAALWIGGTIEVVCAFLAIWGVR